MKKIAVILSGCGNKDGSEIHEASICMSQLELQDPELKLVCTSINEPQYETLNFITQKPYSQNRNVLEESARIARGDIKEVKALSANELDAAVLIGGLGAMKNLTTFFKDKEDMIVHPDVEGLLSDMWKLKKPLGAICIAPLILARVISSISSTPPTITLGEDPSEASRIATSWGANVVSSSSSDIVIDKKNKLVTTPAFMNPGSLRDIYPGITGLAKKLVNF